MVDQIKDFSEINQHDPSILSTLKFTLQCTGYTQQCITGTQILPISKLGGWKNTAFQPCDVSETYLKEWCVCQFRDDVSDTSGMM